MPVQDISILDFVYLNPHGILPLIFQNIQTNGPSDRANIRMPYFSDKPHLKKQDHF